MRSVPWNEICVRVCTTVVVRGNVPFYTPKTDRSMLYNFDQRCCRYEVRMITFLHFKQGHYKTSRLSLDVIGITYDHKDSCVPVDLAVYLITAFYTFIKVSNPQLVIVMNLVKVSPIAHNRGATGPV